MNLNKISRKVSFLLRHKEGFFDEHGWSDVADVVKEIQTIYPDFDEGTLREIVFTDEKGRYSYNQDETRIRANQGHTIPVDVELKKLSPPEILYHGTATRFMNRIEREGLNGQSRIYVHLSSDEETARKVGKRHGKPAVLRIHAGRMEQDGYEFFLSENHVWQTKIVPASYIERMNEEIL